MYEQRPQSRLVKRKTSITRTATLIKGGEAWQADASEAPSTGEEGGVFSAVVPSFSHLIDSLV